VHILQEKPWPAIDLVEPRLGIAFGSSVEKLVDFLQHARRGNYRQVGLTMAPNSLTTGVSCDWTTSTVRLGSLRTRQGIST
jgi:hypothetical protein